MLIHVAHGQYNDIELQWHNARDPQGSKYLVLPKYLCMDLSCLVVDCDQWIQDISSASGEDEMCGGRSAAAGDHRWDISDNNNDESRMAQ